MRALLVPAALLAAAAAVFVTPAQAKPEKGKLFGDWKIDCETQAGKGERCFAVQEQGTREKAPEGQAQPPAKRVLRLSIGYIGPDEKPGMVALVPLGIFLPAGVAFQIDGGQQRPLVVQRCIAEGCLAGTELDEATFKSVRTAQKLLIGLKADPAGQTLVIPVSMNGLDAAIASLK